MASKRHRKRKRKLRDAVSLASGRGTSKVHPLVLELTGEHAFDFGQVEGSTELGAHGCNGAVAGSDPTGDNAGEVRQVRVHVQREAVIRDPAPDGHADGGNL